MFKKQQKGLQDWSGVRWSVVGVEIRETAEAGDIGPYKIIGLYFVSNYVFKIEIKFTYNKMYRSQVF